MTYMLVVFCLMHFETMAQAMLWTQKQRNLVV